MALAIAITASNDEIIRAVNGGDPIHTNPKGPIMFLVIEKGENTRVISNHDLRKMGRMMHGLTRKVYVVK
jgi:hypothetical protein